MPEPTDQPESGPGPFAFANLTSISDKLAVRSRTCEILAILADTSEREMSLIRPEDLRFFAAHVDELDISTPDDPESERLAPYIRQDLAGAFESFAQTMDENHRPFMLGRTIGQMAVSFSETIAMVRIIDSLLGTFNDLSESGRLAEPGPEPGNDAMRQRFPKSAAANLAEAAGVEATDDPEVIIAAIQKLLGS